MSNMVVTVAIATLLLASANGSFSFQGHVSYSDGRPLPGVSVSVVPIPLSDGGRVVLSGADGSYLVQGLSEGNYRLSFVLLGFEGRSVVVSTRKRQTVRRDVTLALLPAAEDGVVCICDPLVSALAASSGRYVTQRNLDIIDAEGKAIPGANLQLFGREYLELTADSAGHVSFSILDGEQAWIRINGAGFRSTQSDVCCYGLVGKITLRRAQ